MSSNSDDQEQWKDVSESSSVSEDDREASILEELELGHVRRIDQENEPPQGNQTGKVYFTRAHLCWVIALLRKEVVLCFSLLLSWYFFFRRTLNQKIATA